ncbi:hypothetical protein Btru_023319 [Bulinus truncatus]|nr:hypothetical protein Btru_023319 [Bulinus truncatus]
MATSTNWRKDLLSQIQRRNRKQSFPFSSLIQTNNKLQEIATSLHTKNVQLQVEIERLKEESLSSLVRGDGILSNANTHQLEQKLYKLQEELTELHKKRGENAQQIIDLTALLQEKDKEIQHKDTMISDMLEHNIALKKSKKTLESAVAELEATNQMLKDEHQALQMAFTSLEERYKKAQEDNNDLIQRWMEQKAKDADRMNAENADFIKARQQRLAKDLEEAAKEQVPIVLEPEQISMPPVCLASSVPSRSQCVFDAHEGEVYSVQWNTMGTLFSSGGADRKIKLWEYHGGVCESRGTLVGSNAGITSLDYNQEDTMILGASNDFASRIWTVGDQRLRHTLTGHSGKVLSAKFLTESKVVSGSHDRTLKVWDLQSKSCVKTIFAGSSCNDLVTLYGASIISGHFDKRIRFWDTRGPTDSSINEILLQGRLTSLSLSNDKNQLLCCTRDDCLKIIDLRMNQVTCTLTADGFKVGCDWSRAVFSPDREYAAAGSGDGNLFVWNVNKAKSRKNL